MLLKSENPGNIVRGNSFSNDGHHGRTFDYMLSNPPFGVEWKKVEQFIKNEYEHGSDRFSAGLPRINDGSFLFLQHMISKMKPPSEGGSRIAIVFNGSPLFTGDAGSGENNIRQWIIENDWLEAIVALPDQLFFNTGIRTYVWIVTNRKARKRRGKVQLINAVDLFQKMRKSLGDKRKQLGEEHIQTIVEIYGAFEECERCKIFDNEDFGFRKITVERPLRLNFQVSPERLKRAQAEIALTEAGPGKKKGGRKGGAIEIELMMVLNAAESLDPSRAYRNRDEFVRDLRAACRHVDVPHPAMPALKWVLERLSERDEDAEICRYPDGKPEPDPELRDTESVPLKEDVQIYFEREVKPHVPDAWIDESKTKVGYEIPFTRHFYEYEPLRSLDVIEAEIVALERQIQGMLGEVLR